MTFEVVQLFDRKATSVTSRVPLFLYIVIEKRYLIQPFNYKTNPRRVRNCATEEARLCLRTHMLEETGEITRFYSDTAYELLFKKGTSC